MTKDHGIDEGLYSRQLYVLGHEAMQKMSLANVLIVGLQGLGVEIAKNVILAGVKSVTLYDPAPAKIADLSSQFYLRESDVGKPRAQACVKLLADLNQYVPVSVLEGELTLEKLGQFKVVVLTDVPLAQQLAYGKFCHENGIYLISGSVRGLFGMGFNDFGRGFTVLDTTGNEAKSGIVASVSRDAEGVVTTLEEHRHGLEDGEYVTFAEVKGMDGLNGCEPRLVKVLGPYTFSIGDTSSLGEYLSGGLFHQVKTPKCLDFKPLAEAIANPDYFITDFAKMERPAQLHVGFQALEKFSELNGGQLPLPRNAEQAKKVIQLANELNAAGKWVEKVDEELVAELAMESRGSVTPMMCVMGGLLAQEVLKACSGKFMPIHQFVYFDSLESLPANTKELAESSFQAQDSRYDGQIALFGEAFQRKIASQKQFLVGAGAIGCEMLKNWAMMGLGTSGKVVVTDMDSIEKSNLNRQFLFRPHDVGSLKSDRAAAAIVEMNPDLKGHIESKQDRVGADSENVFDEAFWSSLSGVTNALDNVEARKYVDRRCVFFRKPLLESGTLGTKGNTQVVVPFLTESYSSSQDPPEKSIPMCTVKSFPNAIEHTIQWARELFDNLFKVPPSNVNMYLTTTDFVEKTVKGAAAFETLESVQQFLVTQRSLSFADCVTWARLKFEELYSNNIQQLLYNFPRDAVTSSGALFWSGPKRAPTPLVFNPESELHLSFISAAANLHAYNYGLKGETDPSKLRALLADVIVPEFQPKKGVKIQVTENENVSQARGNADELDTVIAALPTPSKLAGFRLSPAEFEKDDDTNFHIDFIAAASNLRASNYEITLADRHKTKFIAGRIIPAIATTTSLVTGLVCLELYKLIDGRSRLEDYKNGFINLALPFFGFSEPISAAKFKYHEKEFTLWDRFDIPQDLTLQELIDLFKNEHNLEVTMLTCGVSLLYSAFMPKKDRKSMKISRIVEQVTNKPIPSHAQSIVLEMCVNDQSGEDVEVPYVRINLV